MSDTIKSTVEQRMEEQEQRLSTVSSNVVKLSDDVAQLKNMLELVLAKVTASQASTPDPAQQHEDIGGAAAQSSAYISNSTSLESPVAAHPAGRAVHPIPDTLAAIRSAMDESPQVEYGARPARRESTYGGKLLAPKMVISQVEDFQHKIEHSNVKALLEIKVRIRDYEEHYGREVQLADVVSKKLRLRLILMYVSVDMPGFREERWYSLDNDTVMKYLVQDAMPKTRADWILVWQSTCRFTLPDNYVSVSTYDRLVSQILAYIDTCRRCYAMICDAVLPGTEHTKTPTLLRPQLVKGSTDFGHQSKKGREESLIGLFIMGMPLDFSNMVHRHVFTDGMKLSTQKGDSGFDAYLELWVRFLRETNDECIHLRPVAQALLKFNEFVKQSATSKPTVSALLSHVEQRELYVTPPLQPTDLVEEEDAVMGMMAAFEPRNQEYKPRGPISSVRPTGASTTIHSHAAVKQQGYCWARLFGKQCKQQPCPYDHSTAAFNKAIEELRSREGKQQSQPSHSRLATREPALLQRPVGQKPRVASIDLPAAAAAAVATEAADAVQFTSDEQHPSEVDDIDQLALYTELA